MPIDPNNLSGTAVMTFDDEFNTLSLWNGTSGTWTTTYPFADPAGNGSTLASNGEQEWYINSNYAPTSSVTPWTVSNGDLHLTAAPASASIQPLIDNYQYTSGQLNTVHSFSQTYGYFEMRAELPAGQGLWPAFWLLSENGAWPPELDVMEVLGNSPTTLYTTVHTASTGTNTQESAATTVPDTSTGFHTYGVDWEPDYVTWYFDGKAIDRVATPSDMNSPMYMLLNLAVGGYWPGDANSTTPFPADMTVDWVRAYQSLPNGTETPGSGAPSGGGESLAASGAAVTLPGVSGWTSVAMLSNHDVAIVAPDANGGPGTLTVDDSSGNLVASTTLQDFAAGSPTVTALTGGFSQVTYANATNYEIYNSSGQLVFNHNVYSPAGQTFTPLADGSYVVSNAGSSTLGVVDAGGTAHWVSAPTGAPVGTTSTIDALEGGGFALTWSGSTRFDLFDGSANQVGQGDLGASVSSFATALAPTAGGGFAEAWLSVDGGHNGLPSSLDLQTFNGSGQATSAVITLTQDLDPWHTQIELQTHADGSIAALWSQGGQIWGAEVANGAASQAFAAGVDAALADVTAIQLPNDEAGFAFLEGGDVYAAIFNPTTGAKTVADLGAATGDISTVHALATADGGMAVSWHDASTVLASILSASGQASAPTVVGGDFLGVNTNDQAVTVHSDSTGAAVLQAYAFNHTLFWHA